MYLLQYWYGFPLQERFLESTRSEVLPDRGEPITLGGQKYYVDDARWLSNIGEVLARRIWLLPAKARRK